MLQHGALSLAAVMPTAVHTAQRHCSSTHHHVAKIDAHKRAAAQNGCQRFYAVLIFRDLFTVQQKHRAEKTAKDRNMHESLLCKPLAASHLQRCGLCRPHIGLQLAGVLQDVRAVFSPATVRCNKAAGLCTMIRHTGSQDASVCSARRPPVNLRRAFTARSCAPEAGQRHAQTGPQPTRRRRQRYAAHWLSQAPGTALPPPPRAALAATTV